MAGLIEDLITVLESQYENYKDLLDLSLEKRQAIIDNDVESLQKITNIENTLVSRNQKLEKKRITIIDDMALVLNKKKEDMTIDGLAEMLKNKPEHDTLVAVAAKMRGVLNDLKVKNDNNKALIENSLDYIDFCMNLIRDKVTNKQNFTSYPGAEDVDEKGFFDAKQ